jgi:hypothetical protein
MVARATKILNAVVTSQTPDVQSLCLRTSFPLQVWETSLSPVDSQIKTARPANLT